MRESDLKEELQRRIGGRGILWFPPKVKWYKQNDIFGAFDCLFYTESGVDFIQITTKTNISHRATKIAKCFSVKQEHLEPYLQTKDYPIPDRSYIYAWDHVEENFLVIDVKEYLRGVRANKFLD